MTELVLAANSWTTNGDLIADCAQLGYLKPTDRILDPTYGEGVWWSKWRPTVLDRFGCPTHGPGDFRKMAYDEGEFDVVTFDPPYVCVGGRKSTGMPAFRKRYGLDNAPTTPAKLQQLINDGLTECARVVKPKGYVLVKCQDYVSSGKLWLGTHHTLTHALSLGLECVDRLEMISEAPRPQPSITNGKARVQRHARRNLSTMFVLKKPKRTAECGVVSAGQGDPLFPPAAVSAPPMWDAENVGLPLGDIELPYRQTPPFAWHDA